MGWDDKLSEAKKAASEKAARAKEEGSSKIEDTADSVSETIPGWEDIREYAEGAKKEAVLEYQYTKTGLLHPISRWRVIADKAQDDPLYTIKRLALLDTELREEIVEETVGVGKREARFWATIPYQEFAKKGSKFKQPLYSYGTTALNVSREVDFERTYQYGKYGAKAGAKYGDYIPVVGDFGPHIGFTTGVVMGAADSIDAIDAKEIRESVEPASDAAEEMIQTESDQLQNKMFRGGVAYAESRFGKSTEPSLDELAEMDYSDFAHK